MSVNHDVLASAGSDPPTTLPDPLRADWRRLTSPTSYTTSFSPVLLEGFI